MDGIREDTYPYADPVFLSHWERAILTEYPHFNIVGEIWAESSAFISRFQRGTLFARDFEINLPTVMDFPLMLAYREFIQDTGKLQEVYKVLASDFLYADANNILTMLDNHDTPRAMYIAQGRIDRVKLCLTLLLTLRGIPQILYGTEIGMVGGRKHVELRADFPGGFPGDTRSAFRAAERTDLENQMFNYLRTLLHLRKIHPALSTGKLTQLVPTDEVYMVFKSSQGEDIWIIANGNEEERRIDFSEMTYWFDDVKGLRNLLTGIDLDFHPNMELRIGGIEANIYLLLRTSSKTSGKTTQAKHYGTTSRPNS